MELRNNITSNIMNSKILKKIESQFSLNSIAIELIRNKII